MVSINPIGRAKSREPNCASFKCSCCCMVGIRDAQEEYPKPDIKKKIAHPMRKSRGDLFLTSVMCGKSNNYYPDDRKMYLIIYFLVEYAQAPLVNFCMHPNR